jgi:flavin reductase (DIM6/NTAB) family NADH-FMN oxidoreductase RutF
VKRKLRKEDFPLHDVRRHLEPGPIVLVSSAWNGKTNIMTMGWHMVLGFTPSLVGCYIWDANHSHEMVRKSRECVINVPTKDLADEIVGIGNHHGGRMDKFKKFALTPVEGEKVKAPLIAECYASFECKLYDDSGVEDCFFIWEVVKAHVAPAVKNPKTLHYRGHGEFMVAGPTIDLSEKFTRKGMLD